MSTQEEDKGDTMHGLERAGSASRLAEQLTHRMARLALAVALALAGIFPAAAQVWPEKPLRLIGASAAGGMIDIYARLLQPRLSEGVGQPVIIENRGGASGTVAESLLAKSAPDGYSMLMSADFAPANPHLFRNLNYDLFRDLAPVSMLLRLPLALIVHPAVSAASVADFVAYVRSKRGNFAYASTGAGMSNHLLMVFLQEATGIEMTHVPYKGGAPAMADLVGNQVQASIIAITLAAPLARSGKARAIAMTGRKRAPLLPQVPTFAEAGYADFPEGQWMGLFVPAGTSNAIIQRLHGEFAKAVAAPEVQARLQELGAEAVMNSPAEFAAFLRAEHARLGKLIREHKIRSE